MCTYSYLIPNLATLPCIAKQRDKQQCVPQNISACLAVALSTHIGHAKNTLTYPNLFTACTFWPASKAWPPKHSWQVAGGTVLKRKTTKDHKGRRLQVRLHNTQLACITYQGKSYTCSAGALTRHCFPRLVRLGDPCFAMAWKLYMQISHHPLPSDSSGIPRPQSQTLLIAA